MRGKNFLLSFTKSLVLSAMVSRTISDRYVQVVSVTGPSMLPTLALEGDRLLCEKFCLERHRFSRGDVVAFTSPMNHKEGFVKRLIALPGDSVQVPFSSDIVKIPDGHCWVEGDNAANSTDSRHFGPIPLGLIKGRASHVIWPPKRICQIDRKFPADRILPQ